MLLFVPKVGKLAVIFLLPVIGLYNGWKFLPMSPASYLSMNQPIFTYLHHIAPNRVAGIGAGSFTANLATEYRYFDTNYYDPLYIRRYGELVSYANSGSSAKGLTRSDITVVRDATVSADLSFRRERFWDMTGTSSLIVKKGEYNPCRPKDFLNSKQCPLLWEDASWQVFERESALPRVYLVHEVIDKNNSGAILSTLFNPEFDITKTVVIEEPISLSSNPKTESENVQIQTYKSSEVIIKTTSQANAFLVLSDAYVS